MTVKQIKQKLRIARKIIREQGAIGLGITTLQFIQKHSKRGSSNKHAIDTRAIYEEILRADPSKPANTSWKGAEKKQKLAFNWIMPPPGKGSGGHMTIFRFISYLELAGHQCRIYFFNPSPGSTTEAVKAVMGNSFPAVKAKMSWLQKDEVMDDADGIFATSWETAYTVYSSDVIAKKFYFVQDFEPYFYPVGGLSVLAENTYRLGLRGITAGGWLESKLKQDYGMKTSSFKFGSDSKVYKYDNKNKRKEVVFYARPYTERRGFEVGILALDIFHRNNPEYTINFVGWDVSDYDIPFPHKNLGVLEHNELNDLYNKCAAGLVMSLTNMSLLPLELLSSGTIPVVTDGANNRLVSDNKFIVYSENDPMSLARNLSKVVGRDNQIAHSRKASLSVENCSWDESGKQFVKIVETATRKPGA